MILLQTNENADSFYARKWAFSPFAAEEIAAFIGLLLIFGAWHVAKEPNMCSMEPRYNFMLTWSIIYHVSQQIMCFFRFFNAEIREERKCSDKFATIGDVFDCFV